MGNVEIDITLLDEVEKMLTEYGIPKDTNAYIDTAVCVTIGAKCVDRFHIAETNICEIYAIAAEFLGRSHYSVERSIRNLLTDGTTMIRSPLFAERFESLYNPNTGTITNKEFICELIADIQRKTGVGAAPSACNKKPNNIVKPDLKTIESAERLVMQIGVPTDQAGFKQISYTVAVICANNCKRMSYTDLFATVSDMLSISRFSVQDNVQRHVKAIIDYQPKGALMFIPETTSPRVSKTFLYNLARYLREEMLP